MEDRNAAALVRAHEAAEAEAALLQRVLGSPRKFTATDRRSEMLATIVTAAIGIAVALAFHFGWLS